MEESVIDLFLKMAIFAPVKTELLEIEPANLAIDGANSTGSPLNNVKVLNSL